MSRRIIAAGVLLLLAACSGEADDPEAGLRLWLAEAETAVEARSLTQSADLIAADFQAEQVRTRRDLMRLLLGYFHRHQQIHLLTKVTALSLDAAGEQGRMSVLVAMAGVPIAATSGLDRINADYYHLDLQLRREDDVWRLHSAAWRHATLDDLLKS